MITRENGEWILKSKDGSKILGRFASRAKALAREIQIKMFKHMRLKGKGKP